MLYPIVVVTFAVYFDVIYKLQNKPWQAETQALDTALGLLTTIISFPVMCYIICFSYFGWSILILKKVYTVVCLTNNQIRKLLSTTQPPFPVFIMPSFVSFQLSYPTEIVGNVPWLGGQQCPLTNSYCGLSDP